MASLPDSSPLALSNTLSASAVGGVFTIRSDGLCGYHCLAAVSSLIEDPRALDSGYFPCSHAVVPLTRKRILDTYESWWAVKREFCASDEEMEEREVRSHVDGTSQAFRDRVNGGDLGQVGGLWAWPCDMALYVLNTDVLIVLIDTQRLTATSALELDEVKACEELWFDPVVEKAKKRVVCFVVHKDHFQLGVVRTPAPRFIFERGDDWDLARRLVLTHIKQRIPDAALAPVWAPPGHVPGELLEKGVTSIGRTSIQPRAPGASLNVKHTAQLELGDLVSRTSKLEGGKGLGVRERREAARKEDDANVCQTAAQGLNSGNAGASVDGRAGQSSIGCADPFIKSSKPAQSVSSSSSQSSSMPPSLPGSSSPSLAGSVLGARSSRSNSSSVCKGSLTR